MRRLEDALEYATKLVEGRLDVEAPYHADILRDYAKLLREHLAALLAGGEAAIDCPNCPTSEHIYRLTPTTVRCGKCGWRGVFDELAAGEKAER